MPITPLGAQAGDLLSIGARLNFLGIAIACFFAEPQEPESVWYVYCAAWALLALLSGPWLKKVLRNQLGRWCSVAVFEEKTFFIQRGSNWDAFDRQLPHNFALVPHDKAQEERDEHDFAKGGGAVNRNSVLFTRYYSDSYIVVYEHMGQRHDICAVHGQKEANAILARLVLCDKVMDAQLSYGKGAAITPSKQWDNSSGEIPELS